MTANKKTHSLFKCVCLDISKGRKKGLISSIPLIWLVSKALKIIPHNTSFCIWESPSWDLCKQLVQMLGADVTESVLQNLTCP